MHLFYQPDITPLSHLSEEEAHHAFQVLRLREGDAVGLVNGQGVKAQAVIVSISRKGVSVEVTAQELTERPMRNLHLAIAPVKNMDRFEWLVEKATELGVAVITPVICRHSERRELKTGRLHKLIVAASKQSQRAWFPVLEEAVPLPDFLNSACAGDRFIAHCGAGEKSGSSALRSCKEAVVLIGPEGDFSSAEVQLALEKGFRPLTLGDARLRTETAGLAAVTLFYITA